MLQGKASEFIAQLQREVAAGTLTNQQLHRDLEVRSCTHLPFCAILVLHTCLWTSGPELETRQTTHCCAAYEARKWGGCNWHGC